MLDLDDVTTEELLQAVAKRFDAFAFVASRLDGARGRETFNWAGNLYQTIGMVRALQIRLEDYVPSQRWEDNEPTDQPEPHDDD